MCFFLSTSSAVLVLFFLFPSLTEGSAIGHADECVAGLFHPPTPPSLFPPVKKRKKICGAPRRSADWTSSITNRWTANVSQCINRLFLATPHPTPRLIVSRRLFIGEKTTRQTFRILMKSALFSINIVISRRIIRTLPIRTKCSTQTKCRPFFYNKRCK